MQLFLLMNIYATAEQCMCVCVSVLPAAQLSLLQSVWLHHSSFAWPGVASPCRLSNGAHGTEFPKHEFQSSNNIFAGT